MSFACHPLEGGDPANIILLDSRLRGNDKIGCGSDNGGVIPVKTHNSPKLNQKRKEDLNSEGLCRYKSMMS
ncbi:MAG: hypothetical protein SFT93_05375 [Rickettsiaceae bacterium]|nr:hypothetical protein [Rickettsiaceae bacterium]